MEGLDMPNMQSAHARYCFRIFSKNDVLDNPHGSPPISNSARCSIFSARDLLREMREWCQAGLLGALPSVSSGPAPALSTRANALSLGVEGPHFDSFASQKESLPAQALLTNKICFATITLKPDATLQKLVSFGPQNDLLFLLEANFIRGPQKGPNLAQVRKTIMTRSNCP